MQTRIRSLEAHGLIDAVRPQVAFELVVHDTRGNQQGQFAELGELMPFREGGVPIGRRGTQREVLHCGSVHDDDFVRRAVQEAAGNAVGGAVAGNAFDLVLKFFEVLQVNGRDH